MEHLKRSIRKLRISNYDERKFVPYNSLCEVMTENAVQSALWNIEIRRQSIQETVHAIVPGGRKIFAILVLDDNAQYITKFLEDDQLQQIDLDHRLPYSIDRLRQFLPQDDTSDLFYERQWEFTAPIFSGKVFLRCLDSRTVLPFIHNEKIGSGGFGHVYHIRIHNEYCMLEEMPQRAVCY